MAAFQYQALDAAGRELSGVIDADSPRQARSELRLRRLLPLAVAPVAAGTGAAGRRGRLPARARVLATRQWASLLAAGLTLGEALDSLVDQHEDPRVKNVFAGVRAEVAAGLPLHQALAAFPDAFPPLYLALVRAGEQSGELPRVLAALADHLEGQAEVRRRTLAAMLYPALVSLVGLLVVIGLMVYVVPQVTAVFEHGRQSLPLLTRLLVAAGKLALPALILALPLGLAAAWAARRALRDPQRRRRFHAFLLRLPVLGPLLRAAETARFAATLAILAGGGVPLLSSLETGRQVLRLLPIQAAVAEAIAAVAEGAPLARALAAGRAFPSLLVHLVAGGEKSGRLPEMLERAAKLLQAEVDEGLGILTTLLEPLMILFMGGIVLTVVLAIMQPILEVNQLLR